MSDYSSSSYKACLEKWRNAVPTTWQQEVAHHFVERERSENNMVELEILFAEQSLARLRLAAALCDAEHEGEEHEVSDSSLKNEAASMEIGSGSSISFSAGCHPEHRSPMRHGTPFPLPATPVGYFADDEREAPLALTRRKTRCSGSFSDVPLAYSTPTPPTPEQSPVHSVRPLRPSEFWDDDAAVEHTIVAPVPQRPFKEPELLLLGYKNHEAAHGGPSPAFSGDDL